MESLAALYKNHIVTLQERTRDALERFKLDALLIHSGELINVFLDDHPYPFKVNPQFKAWVPVTQVPNCWLLVDGVNKPKLWFYLPVDYWHNVEPLPTSFWTEEIEIIALPKADGIGSQPVSYTHLDVYKRQAEHAYQTATRCALSAKNLLRR